MPPEHAIAVALVTQGWRVVDDPSQVSICFGWARRGLLERFLTRYRGKWRPGLVRIPRMLVLPTEDIVLRPDYDGGPAIMAHPDVADQIRRAAEVEFMEQAGLLLPGGGLHA